MNRRGDLDAIVVGAGVIGAATALALARDGLDVALVEAREPGPWHVEDDVDLRVVALAPDARELLDDLDVWTAIRESRIGPYRYMRVWDALASGELAFDAADSGQAALGWIIENKLIQHALWQALQTHDAAVASTQPTHSSPAGARRRNDESRQRPDLVAPPRVSRNADESSGSVRLICPAEVAEIDNGENAVSATLSDGTRLRARLLIAAEGAGSSLRTKLGIAFDGRDYDQRAVVAHVATERSHEATAWQRFLPGGPLAFLPLADGRSSIVWSLPDAEATRILALDDEAFRAELGCASDFRLGAITGSGARAAFPLRLRLAERYVAGRCVLIGDAAHVVHPLAGQGMNLGLRDVRCLRRVLRDARKRGTDPGAHHILRRYERERRSENRLAAYGLDAIERMFGTMAMPVATLRGAGLAAITRIAPLRDLLAAAAAGRV
jgi:2-octaprenyl-3-methyl-6-methoxy-1,4-benzoquinol hydroxylase/2-octaprenylphenol hydroxylase